MRKNFQNIATAQVGTTVAGRVFEFQTDRWNSVCIRKVSRQANLIRLSRGFPRHQNKCSADTQIPRRTPLSCSSPDINVKISFYASPPQPY
jgi:hypothetical protein